MAWINGTEPVSLANIALHSHRAGMTRAGAKQLSAAHIGHHVKGRRQEWFSGSTKNSAKTAVNLGQESAGVRRHRHQLLDEPAHDRRHERRAHSVPHHIANEYAGRSVTHREPVKKIASDSRG